MRIAVIGAGGVGGYFGGRLGDRAAGGHGRRRHPVSEPPRSAGGPAAGALGRARGVPLADDYIARQLATLDALPAEMRSSMLNDLVAGNRLEAPWLSGAVARMAAESGLAAPVSATLYAAVKPYLNGASH